LAISSKQYSPKLKFQVVLEALSREKTPGHIAELVSTGSRLILWD
jgi:hypothetical protein